MERSRCMRIHSACSSSAASPSACSTCLLSAGSVTLSQAPARVVKNPRHEFVLLDQLRVCCAVRIGLPDARQQKYDTHDQYQWIPHNIRNADANQDKHRNAKNAGPQAEHAQSLCSDLLSKAVLALCLVVTELPAVPGTDPFLFHERQARIIEVRSDVTLGAGNSHNVSNPAKIGILHLQEIIVRILGHVVVGHAGGSPVKLHA